MGFFDFLDSRKSVAKWAAKLFRQARQTNPELSTQNIIDLALQSRYSVIGPKPHQAEILRTQRHGAIDIFSFCHLIAEVEFLSHLNGFDRITLQMGGENIVQHTYNVIDNELIKLGFVPSSSVTPQVAAAPIPTQPKQAPTFPITQPQLEPELVCHRCKTVIPRSQRGSHFTQCPKCETIITRNA